MAFIQGQEKSAKPLAVFRPGAHHEFIKWIAENSWTNFFDRAGTDWVLRHNRVDTVDALGKKLNHKVVLWLAAEVLVSQLVGQGVLDPVKDERLIRLVGDKKITMILGRRTINANGSQGLKQGLIDYVDMARGFLSSSANIEEKRAMVIAFIERSSLFGL